jgi:hypothetical protein
VQVNVFHVAPEQTDALGAGRDAGIAVNHAQLWTGNMNQKSEIPSEP